MFGGLDRFVKALVARHEMPLLWNPINIVIHWIRWDVSGPGLAVRGLVARWRVILNLYDYNNSL